MALGAAQEYLRQLEAIPRLSAAGGGQAAADAEYFCNVLSALGVPLPSQLGTWQVGGSGIRIFGFLGMPGSILGQDFAPGTACVLLAAAGCCSWHRARDV